MMEALRARNVDAVIQATDRRMRSLAAPEERERLTDCKFCGAMR